MPTLIQCSTNRPSRYDVTRLISWDPRCAFYEFVPSFPIYGWLAWWCDFFPVGPTFEEFSQKKGPAPWTWFLTPVPRPLEVTFLLAKLNICVCTLFARQMCLQLYKFWTSRSVEFSGLNGIVRVCYYFWPLNLHFTFWERPFVTSNMHLEINILCPTYANSAL